MADQLAHAGAHEQEVKTLSVEEYQKLLKILKIRLPKGALTPEVIARSTHTSVIQDAESIKQDLEKSELFIATIPRLACGNTEQALQLKEKEKFQEMTKMIFFRTPKKRPVKETSVKKWRKQMKPGCGFQIRKTYREIPPQAAGRAARKGFYGKHADNQKNAMDCFSFYLKKKGLTEDDVNYKKSGKLEFEFLSGKPPFLVGVKSSPEDISPTEKIIIKCNTATSDMAKEIFSPSKKGFQAPEFKTSHQYYLQAQAFLFILEEKEKMEENPVPVTAVMVIKMKPSGRFYWSEVREDTEKMEHLNNSCKTEALPRFLAVLNLIFEKEN